MTNLSLVLELREKYQKTEYGMDLEEQVKARKPLLRKAMENNIPDFILQCPDNMFEVFKEKLNQQQSI